MSQIEGKPLIMVSVLYSFIFEKKKSYKFTIIIVETIISQLHKIKLLTNLMYTR